MSSVSLMSSDIKQKTEMSRSKSRERKLSFDKALGFDMTTLKESLALAEMKAAAASREIVKNIDIKNKLRFIRLLRIKAIADRCLQETK